MNEAAIGMHLEVVKRELSQFLPPHLHDKPPLHMAAEKGSRVLAELLLADGADVNAKDTSGYTPLHVAAGKGSRDVAELLLANGADVNAKGWGGTPLHMAAKYGRTDLAALLLAHGADVNSKDGPFGGTPLHVAAENGHTDLAALLLANRADVNAIAAGEYRTSQRRPLARATCYGRKDVATLLRRHGGKVTLWERLSAVYEWADDYVYSVAEWASKTSKSMVKVVKRLTAPTPNDQPVSAVDRLRTRLMGLFSSASRSRLRSLRYKWRNSFLPWRNADLSGILLLAVGAACVTCFTSSLSMLLTSQRTMWGAVAAAVNAYVGGLPLFVLFGYLYIAHRRAHINKMEDAVLCYKFATQRMGAGMHDFSNVDMLTWDDVRQEGGLESWGERTERIVRRRARIYIVVWLVVLVALGVWIGQETVRQGGHIIWKWTSIALR